MRASLLPGLIVMAGCVVDISGAPCLADANCPKDQRCVEKVCRFSDGGTSGGGGGGAALGGGGGSATGGGLPAGGGGGVVDGGADAGLDAGVDLDGDGAALPADCDDTNPAIYPAVNMKEAILRTLQHTGGRRSEAASILGIGLRTLQRKSR